MDMLKRRECVVAETRQASCSEILLEKLRNRDAVIGIIGMGYVGLPLAYTSTRAGYATIGFDINSERVEAILAGENVINYLDSGAATEALASGRFTATTDFARLAEADAILICVPTPLTQHREPDLSYVEASVRSIANMLRPGQLIVLESTTWPGTTRELVQPLLEAAGGEIGETCFLAFSPEREDPGNARFSTHSIPKVVGADDEASRACAIALYEQIVETVVPVSSAATAEAVKLTENIYRSINIALVNELKHVFGQMGIDVWEVIDAAATKPFGFQAFYPGPGLGGHCVPIDPFYLTWKAREYGIETRFIELAGHVNTDMPRRVVEAVVTALNSRHGKAMSGARVLVLWLSYKADVNDTRESPSLELIELMEARGARCDYHAPHVPEIPPTRRHPSLSGRCSQELGQDMLASYDAVLIATAHSMVDYALVAEASQLIIDTRNIIAKRGLPLERVVKA